MDITRENFESMFPIIEAEIKNCDFISIDCEFSGLGSRSNGGLFDTPAERYYKKVTGELNFDIVQFGLSIFTTSNSNANEIKCSCYNFYIFKYHVKNSILKDREFLISSSAFEFLSQNNFDFNKLFKHGVTYCNIEEEQNSKAATSRQEYRLLLNEETNSKDQRAVYRAICEYNDFLKDSQRKILLLGPYDQRQLNLVKGKIQDCEKNRRNSPETNLGIKESGVRLKLRAMKKGRTNYWELEVMKDFDGPFEYDYEKIAEESKGFTKIIHAIIQHRKPIVGHNSFLDILHIVHQFISRLPIIYEDFQMVIKELFPLIFDTKHISVFLESLNRRKVKSLDELFDYLKNKYPNYLNNIKVVNSDDLVNELLKPKKDNGNKLMFHQAAFDSLITGLCFFIIKSIVEAQTKKPIYNDSRFVNKFFNAFSFDIPYLTTDPDENIKLDRSNVFYIEFDCEPSELEDKFKDFDTFNVEYLTDNSCLVGISHSQYDKNKLNNLISLNNASLNPLRIETFDFYYENLSTFKEPRHQKIMVNEYNINPDLNPYATSCSDESDEEDSSNDLDSFQKRIKIELSEDKQGTNLELTDNKKDSRSGLVKSDKDVKPKAVFEEIKEWDV